jgi:hypothetical protein
LHLDKHYKPQGYSIQQDIPQREAPNARINRVAINWVINQASRMKSTLLPLRLNELLDFCTHHSTLARRVFLFQPALPSMAALHLASALFLTFAGYSLQPQAATLIYA